MASPFIRSAGGKTKLAPQFFEHLPKSVRFDTYVEPFLGAGGFFFWLEARGFFANTMVILGDADPDLVALWAAVQENPEALVFDTNLLIKRASTANHPQGVYLDERSMWNVDPIHRTPARHLFLRKGAWNGLWRTNKAGAMNTPWRGKPPAPVDGALLEDASGALAAANILDWDFRQYRASEFEEDGMFIGPGTLVYLDPPYLGDAGDFVAYTKHGWSEYDAVELLKLAQDWTLQGAHVLLSNKDTPAFRALIGEHWSHADVHQIMAARSINSDGGKRGKIPEVLVVGRCGAADVD